MSEILEKHDVNVLEDSIDTILIDVDLLVKYKSPKKAFDLLRKSIEQHPRKISLREKMLEIAKAQMNMDEVSQQCVALAELYINYGQFDLAYDRLLEAKASNPQISIDSGLEAIHQARQKNRIVSIRSSVKEHEEVFILVGDVAAVDMFNIIKKIESSGATGLLLIRSNAKFASIAFNDGKIVDTRSEGVNSTEAFRKIMRIEEGTFEFKASNEHFPEVINVVGNKVFLLDPSMPLRAEKAEKVDFSDLNEEES